MAGDYAYTGVTTKTAERYWIDSGAIYKNLVIGVDGAYTSGDLLGATEGGNEFKVEQKVRYRKVDGIKEHSKGNAVIDEEIVTLKVNLKELTAANLSLALAGSTVDSTGTAHDIIKGEGKIDLADYLTNIALVGRVSRSGKPIIVMIKNAISLEGLTVKTDDNNEVVIPLVFTGHYDDTGVPPYEIYWPKETV